jgi:hypothetical protein
MLLPAPSSNCFSTSQGILTHQTRCCRELKLSDQEVIFVARNERAQRAPQADQEPGGAGRNHASNDREGNADAQGQRDSRIPHYIISRKYFSQLFELLDGPPQIAAQVTHMFDVRSQACKELNKTLNVRQRVSFRVCIFMCSCV